MCLYVCIIWLPGGVLNPGLPEFQVINKLIHLDKGKQLTAQPLYSVLIIFIIIIIIIILIVINFVLSLLLDGLYNDNAYILYG
jgi:hypothetical protein